MTDRERKIAHHADGLIDLARDVINRSGLPGFTCRGSAEVRRTNGEVTREETLILVVLGRPRLQRALMEVIENYEEVH